MVSHEHIIGNNRGSEWSKWDLHIHSPRSWLNNNYKNCSDDDFIKTIKENEIAVVGLTNYFKFADGEIDGESNLKQKLEQNGIVVFPNLEIRLSFQNKEDDLCDYHIVFDPKTTKQQIDELLANLEVDVGDGTKRKASSLTEEMLRSNSLHVDFERILSIVNDESLNLRAHIVTGFLSRGKGESRSSAASDRICIRSDFIIHSSDSVKNIQEDYEFWTQDANKPIKPILQGSDAHSLKDIGQKFSWVKALPTMDGFRQVIANPAERLRFQNGNPNQTKSSSMIIDRIETRDGAILLNQDLTSIIGMRGNGKSVLLKAIASKVDPEDFFTKLGDRADSDKKWRDEVFGNELKIYWADGFEDSGTAENPKRLFYLPQGYLSNIAYEENAKEQERKEFLLELLRKNEGFYNAEKQAQEFLNLNGQGIHKTIDNLLAEKNIIENTLENSKSLGNVGQLKEDARNLDEKIKALGKKSKISNEDQAQYSVSKAEIPQILSKIKTASQDIEILVALQKSVPALVSEVRLSGLSKETRQKIEAEAEIKGDKVLRDIFAKQQGDLRATITKLETELNTHQAIVMKLGPKFDEQKEMVELIARKSEIDVAIKRIQVNSSIVDENKKFIEQNIENLCKMFFQYKQKQLDIFETVKFGRLEFVSIKLELNERAKNDFIESYINIKKQCDVQKASKVFIESGQIKDVATLKGVIEDIINGKLIIKKGFANNVKRILNDLLENPFEIDFMRSIKTEDEKTNFLDMTGGQKAIAMLELIFTFDTNHYPILLDQPEDDIDTSGVSGSIVDFVKKQKEKRQIIIVSHSGSLVVCSDSEEIIVAKHNKKKYMYQTGAIEDKTIRAEIIAILEGGEEALKLRMKKLQYMV